MEPDDTNDELDQADHLISFHPLTAENFHQYWEEHISQYVEENLNSTNTKLLSILALLNAYVPESYLPMEECERILGPPDPIHGGPPFEKRMEPFTKLINVSHPQHVCLISPKIAESCVELLAGLKISRSDTVMKCMVSLCGEQTRLEIIQLIKDLLTKREMGDKGKEKFSRLIEDLKEKEQFYKAISVLKMASNKFKQKHIFPQTLSRLYYIGGNYSNYTAAEKWAHIAIRRAENNSYVADTLGQVYKNNLRKKCRPHQKRRIVKMAGKAFRAFKEVEKKAEKEEDSKRTDMAGAVSLSDSFNNRGLFGFIQVVKILIDKQGTAFYHVSKSEVEAKFEFFEWYLGYSSLDVTTLEPDYFWKDIALCYKHYTGNTAADSNSFPGLLDRLNHGLFTSKGKRAGFEETVKTKSDLETIRQDLRSAYEKNGDDANMAERYILSNIILNSKIPDSPEHSLMRELQTIVVRFLQSEKGHRSPEFYLLVLLLSWPEEHHQMVEEKDTEEMKQQTTVDTLLQEKDDDFAEEQDNGEEPSQPLPGFILYPDLQQNATFMKDAFERKYAKYLRGRYLLPLFFLGKGSGLSKWIHKSRLDAIVEENVNAEQSDNQYTNKEKMRRIKDMWKSGQVWQLPQVKDILLPVQTELSDSSTMVQLQEGEVFVCAGGTKIKTRIENNQNGSTLSPVLFYLGFNIQGPVVFKVGVHDFQ